MCMCDTSLCALRMLHVVYVYIDSYTLNCWILFLPYYIHTIKLYTTDWPD